MKPNVETWALENRIDPSTLVDGKLDEFLSELGYKYAIGFKNIFFSLSFAYTLVRPSLYSKSRVLTSHFAASIDPPCDDNLSF